MSPVSLVLTRDRNGRTCSRRTRVWGCRPRGPGLTSSRVCRQGSGQGCRAGQLGAHSHAGLRVEEEPGDGGERAQPSGAAAEWTLSQGSRRQDRSRVLAGAALCGVSGHTLGCRLPGREVRPTREPAAPGG